MTKYAYTETITSAEVLRNKIRKYKKLAKKAKEFDKLKDELKEFALANDLVNKDTIGTETEYLTYVKEKDGVDWDTKALEADGLAEKYKVKPKAGRKYFR